MTDVFSTRSRRVEGDTEKLNDWGVDSETGVLRDVLVGPVDNFKKILPTNSINRQMIREGVALDVAGAQAQYNEVLDIFRSAGANVHITPADEVLPLQIWGRDGSFMTPWGIVIAQMAQWWRRGEYGPVLDFCFENNLPLYDKITVGCFEGGDFIITKAGHVLLGYSGERSQEEGALQVKSWFEKEGWDVCLYEFDAYFVHADVTIAMLAKDLAAVCLDVVNEPVVDWLKNSGIEIIDIPFKHSKGLGINVVSLGNDRVLLPKQSAYLAEKCLAVGLEVFDPDVSKITVCGGGIHCMCQPLRRDPE